MSPIRPELDDVVLVVRRDPLPSHVIARRARRRLPATSTPAHDNDFFESCCCIATRFSPTSAMDPRTRSLFGQRASGIPKPRPSAYSAHDSGIPKPTGRATLSTGMGRQSSGYGLSRPSAYNPTSAVKSVASSSARKSIFFSARKSHTPQTGRSSFNPSSVTSTASRQSIGGQRSIIEDRPITDVSYHKQCVAKLNDFLQQKGQPAMQSRFCASPTSSEIRHAFELLFREMGVNLNTSNQIPKLSKSWDQELAATMRSLGYRYAIAKNFTVSSTSTNSKGQLFGMFDWLVDAISYYGRSGLDHILHRGQEQGVILLRELFKVAICSDPVLREQKLKQIGEACYGTEEEYQQMMEQEMLLQQEIEALEMEIRETEQLKRLRSDYENECVKFDKYEKEMAEQLDAHRESAERELPLVQQKIVEAETLIQEQEEKNKRITNQLSEQEFGQEDLKWARERQQQLKEETAREVKAIDEQKRSLRDIRLTVKQEEDKLFKMQSDMHSMLMSLKEAVLSPNTAPYAQQLQDLLQGKKLDAATHFLIQPISLTPDATEKRILLRDLVREYKMEVVQQTVALEGSIMPCSEQKINDLKAAIAEREKENQIVRDEITQLNHEILADCQEHKSEHGRLKNEYALNQTFLKEQAEKLKKSETETDDRVRKQSEVVSKLEADVKQQKQQQLKWLREYTSDQTNIFRQVQQKVEQKVRDAKSYAESLAAEKKRQKAVVVRLHKKISNHKASKQHN